MYQMLCKINNFYLTQVLVQMYYHLNVHAYLILPKMTKQKNVEKLQ